MLEYTSGGLPRLKADLRLLPKLARGGTRRIVAYAQFLIGQRPCRTGRASCAAQQKGPQIDRH